MPELFTYPSIDEMEEINKNTPAYMFPNHNPFAVVGEGWLSDKECDMIITKYDSMKTYEFHGCNAITRECPRPLDFVLDPLVRFTRYINQRFWKYDWSSTGAFLQTYTPGRDYQKHMDVAPCQGRKLTAVLMLTDEAEYNGGDLKIFGWPGCLIVPKTRGTVVVFPSWLTHEVRALDEGMRQTINLGFWGADFK